MIRVDHGNGTAVVRQYDAADRLTLIRHEDVVGDAILELAYTFSADGLVTRIIETDEVSEASSFPPPPGEPVPPIISQVDFEYDDRNRLTREMRDTVNNVVDIELGTARYDLSYTYDAGGNRLSKTNNISGRVTTYTYDITETNDGDQHNNRLLAYDVTDTDPASGAPIAVEQTLYQYGPAGNVMKLVKRMDTTGDDLIDQADAFAAVWWFYYDTSNKLWLAVQGTGMFDEAEGTLSGTVFEKAAEYRYDGGRQRYLVRQRDPDPNANWAIIGTGQWRDYMGNHVYNDYTVDQATGTVTNGTGYVPGIGYDDASMTDAPAYYGSDLIGTARRVSDSSTGAPPVVHRSVLTAFGEPISSTGTGNTRYGYAGVWGYETPEDSFDPLADLGWLHVGERYYDPGVGRFMQRDPIGIRGGFNVYIYVANNPGVHVDPLGLTTITGFIGLVGDAKTAVDVATSDCLLDLAETCAAYTAGAILAGISAPIAAAVTVAGLGIEAGISISNFSNELAAARHARPSRGRDLDDTRFLRLLKRLSGGQQGGTVGGGIGP